MFSVALLAAAPQPTPVPADTKTEVKAPSEKFIVYYFMTTMRCPSCHKIETYTHATVTDKFAEEIKAGTMEWKMVNTDEAANEHFIKDYSLFTKSVIISKVVDGKEVSWKYLDKVWELLSNQDNFQKYIENEIRAFIKEKK
jgi:hypothetical protein